VFSQEAPGTFTQGNGASVGTVFVIATPLSYTGTGAERDPRARHGET